MRRKMNGAIFADAVLARARCDGLSTAHVYEATTFVVVRVAVRLWRCPHDRVSSVRQRSVAESSQAELRLLRSPSKHARAQPARGQIEAAEQRADEGGLEARRG